MQDTANTRWRIDPSRSTVEFQVPNLYGLQAVKGRFERYDGTLAVAESPAIELTIEVDSLNTGNAKRDKHLRSADFFDAENHPHVRFTSRSGSLDGERLKVSGHLQAAGQIIPLDVEAALRGDADELEVDATVLADQRRLGMTWSPLGMLRAPSRLVVRGRLVQDEM